MTSRLGGNDVGEAVTRTRACWGVTRRCVDGIY
jgi:hypothetical protein